MPAVGAAGKPKATSSPTAAPVTVIVKSAEAAAAISAKFKDAEFANTDSTATPAAPIKPACDTTGPENVVRDIIIFLT